MVINETLLDKNQDYINFWNAFRSYNDLNSFMGYFTLFDHETLEHTIEHVYKRDFNDEKTVIDNYLIRSAIIKKATETCELFCKAILVANGKNWNEMKSLGHHLLDCFNSLPLNQKKMILNAPFDRIVSRPYDLHTEIIQLSETDNQNVEGIDILNCLSDFETKPVLPNIKARYPGEDIVDFDERFIVGYTRVLYLLSLQEYTKNNIFVESLSFDESKLR